MHQPGKTTCLDYAAPFRTLLKIRDRVIILFIAEISINVGIKYVDSVESTCLNVDEQQFVHAYVLIRHDNTRMIH